MKFHIKNTLETLEIKGYRDPQVKISQTWNKKVVHRIFKAAKMFLDNKFKKLENNTNYIENMEYIDCRNKLDKIYEQKINGMELLIE